MFWPLSKLPLFPLPCTVLLFCRSPSGSQTGYYLFLSRDRYLLPWRRSLTPDKQAKAKVAKSPHTKAQTNTLPQVQVNGQEKSLLTAYGVGAGGLAGIQAARKSSSLSPRQCRTRVCLLVGCLTSQQHASVSQGRICTDNFTCRHTEIEAADQTFHLTQSQYTDTGQTSPSADPITPGAWQGSHWSANV